MDDLLTNPAGALIVGLIVALFGGFIVVAPNRFLHPFRGEKVRHSLGAITCFRLGGLLPLIAGFRIVAASVWALLKRTS